MEIRNTYEAHDKYHWLQFGLYLIWKRTGDRAGGSAQRTEVEMVQEVDAVDHVSPLLCFLCCPECYRVQRIQL